MQFLVLELVVQTVMGLLRWLLLVVRALPYLAGYLAGLYVRVFRAVWQIDVEIFRQVRARVSVKNGAENRDC